MSTSANGNGSGSGSSGAGGSKDAVGQKRKGDGRGGGDDDRSKDKRPRDNSYERERSRGGGASDHHHRDRDRRDRDRDRERDHRDHRDHRDYRDRDHRDRERDHRDDRRGGDRDRDTKYSGASGSGSGSSKDNRGATTAARTSSSASASSASASASSAASSASGSGAIGGGPRLTPAEEAARKKQKEDEEFRLRVEKELDATLATAAAPLTEEEEVELARKRRAERLAKIAAAAKAAQPAAATAAATTTATAAPTTVTTPMAATATTAAPAVTATATAANGKHTPVQAIALPSPKLSAAAAPATTAKPPASPSVTSATAVARTPTATAAPASATAAGPVTAAAPATPTLGPSKVANDAFDMFGPGDDPIVPVTATRPAAALAMAAAAAAAGDDAATLQDNWDDHEGYYKFVPGDVLDGRYQVFASQGRGVFSTVLRVRDVAPGQNQRELVIKVIRVDGSHTFRKAGQKELEFCRLLAEKDPEGKRHVIRLVSYFEHRNHLCLVFEPLSMNLRELLRKFGGVGLTVVGVKSFAKQLFVALKHLKRCGVIHADLKPDNILVNDNLSVVKVCDFGSAGRLNECEITPYLVSRFYRAPEIMLGLPYNEQLDVWSVGCILYELYTGKILFPGANNNDMLRLQQELKGPFPNRMLKKAQFRAQHFDDDFTYEQTKKDAITGIDLKKKIKFLRPLKELHTLMLNASGAKQSESERRKVGQLADLCSKCFVLDPAKRITVEQALLHPFVAEA